MWWHAKYQNNKRESIHAMRHIRIRNPLRFPITFRKMCHDILVSLTIPIEYEMISRWTGALSKSGGEEHRRKCEVPCPTFIYPNSFRWLGPRMRRQTDRIFWETLQLLRKFFSPTSITTSAIQSFLFPILPSGAPRIHRLRLIFFADVHVGAILTTLHQENIDICVNIATLSRQITI